MVSFLPFTICPQKKSSKKGRLALFGNALNRKALEQWGLSHPENGQIVGYEQERQERRGA